MRQYYANNLLRYEKRSQITEKDLKFILAEVTDVIIFKLAMTIFKIFLFCRPKNMVSLKMKWIWQLLFPKQLLFTTRARRLYNFYVTFVRKLNLFSTDELEEDEILHLKGKKDHRLTIRFVTVGQKSIKKRSDMIDGSLFHWKGTLAEEDETAVSAEYQEPPVRDLRPVVDAPPDKISNRGVYTTVSRKN